ncbi:MAG: alpha/beta hydrolase [Ilumatobacteraceae bacterium]
MTPPNPVPSTDGVQLAVHDLGGAGPTLLISHATGFHGRCYIPVADALADRFHSVAFDYRGHGDTPQPERPIDWERYGDDALAMAQALVAASGAPLVAFGHSMGGACLLMAAHRDPSLFARLVLFEPIVFPTEGVRPPGEDSPLVGGARRRRSSFASYEAAIANFAAKPPLNAFTPEALEAYVRYGFAQAPDGTVHLKCRPEIESGTFELGGKHDTWSVLESIEVPVVVAAGRAEETQPPSLVAEEVAAKLPNGRFARLAALDHFAPMTAPEVIADVIAAG